MNKSKKYILLFILLGLLIYPSINVFIYLYSQDYIYSEISGVPEYSLGLVLGAGVRSDGTPTDILRDRLDSAIEVYRAGKIENIIVSGDNGSSHYDEPSNMAKYLYEKGIPENDVYIDYAGFDTYDSLYRAGYIFGAKKIIVFTQKYHLSRSVYIGRRLGIDSIGYVSDKRTYLAITRFRIRESLSRIKAFLNVEILHSKPKFLGEKIEIK